MISLEKNANGEMLIVFKSKYDQHLVKRIKDLPGAKWDSARKIWTAPADPAYYGNIERIEREYLDATDEVKKLCGIST